MSKSTLSHINRHFQEDPEFIGTYDGPDLSPRFIVGTTKMIGVGLTFHKARRLVQVDPEWMERDHRQGQKRINRIGQTRDTFTYDLFNTDSAVEATIYDRQGRRAALLKLALDPSILDTSNFQRGQGEYDVNSDDESENDGLVQDVVFV